MGAPKIDEIAKDAQEWDFIQNLPDSIGIFKKQLENKIEGQILHICSYNAPELKAKIDLIYTSETFDYILIRSIGMNIYRDISLIYREKEVFAKMVNAKLPQILHSIEHPEEENLGEMVEAKKILSWEYEKELPEKIGPFELFIKPSKSIEYINGSIILIDYSDFTRDDQFVVFYNRHRNEFFAETKIASVFHATKDFDAKTLDELKEQLEKHLETTLTNITNSSHEI